MDNIDAFTQDEFEETLFCLVKDFASPSRITRSEHPKAFLLGGQSGVGKATLHNVCADMLDGNAIVINGDEYRSLHPRFEALKKAYGDDWVSYTAPWSGQLVEGLIDAFSRMKLNLVIEGTLRTSAVPLKTASLLNARGYSTSLALMAVKPEVSLISCQIRYEQMRVAGTTPRATGPAHHAKIVQDIVDNLGELEQSGQFSDIRLYSRAGACLWPSPAAQPGSSPLAAEAFEDSDVIRATAPRGGKKKGVPKTSSEALRAILFGPWTEEDLFHHHHLQQQLEALKDMQTGE